jgi:hypothetical protein
VAEAKKCCIKASLAMPIMTPHSNEVLAVLEVASNATLPSFNGIISHICKSVWQFGLKSLDVSRHHSVDSRIFFVRPSPRHPTLPAGCVRPIFPQKLPTSLPQLKARTGRDAHHRA